MMTLTYLRSAAFRAVNSCSASGSSQRGGAAVQLTRGFGSRCCDSSSDPSETTTAKKQREHQLEASRSLTFMKTTTEEDAHEDLALEKLFKHNKAWRERINEEDPTYFPKLGQGQSPDFLYIGCADSRVNITALTGVSLGELFIHRNIANMVVSSDMNLLAVLTYAVEYLKVKHILVTGHYDCGGVRAAVQKEVKGQILDSWLQNIRDVYRLHKAELDAIADDEERHRRLVELNVVEQCLNLLKTDQVQQSRLRTSKDPNSPFSYPRIHGLVFDPATGVLSKIPINFRKEITELRDLYDLYDIGAYEDRDKEHFVDDK